MHSNASFVQDPKERFLNPAQYKTRISFLIFPYHCNSEHNINAIVGV